MPGYMGGVMEKEEDDQHTARLNMPGFSALLKSLPSATLA